MIDLQQNKHYQLQVEIIFSMNIDVTGNFTLNVGDLVWCEVPSYNASEATSDNKVERNDVVDQVVNEQIPN